MFLGLAVLAPGSILAPRNDEAFPGKAFTLPFNWAEALKLRDEALAPHVSSTEGGVSDGTCETCTWTKDP